MANILEASFMIVPVSKIHTVHTTLVLTAFYISTTCQTMAILAVMMMVGICKWILTAQLHIRQSQWQASICHFTQEGMSSPRS